MKHSHYHKDVSHLATIDVYQVCELFDIQDSSGATQHAIKKLLCAGLRGAKSHAQDIQEAIDTLERWKAMRAEEESAEMPGSFGQANVMNFGGYPSEEIGADVRFDQSGRQEVVEQNGNTAEHYACDLCGAGPDEPHDIQCGTFTHD